MADDKNFKALVEEQKKATVALNKIAGINAEETDAVKSQGQQRERTEKEKIADYIIKNTFSKYSLLKNIS